MFDIFNMLKKEAHTAPKQVTRDLSGRRLPPRLSG